MTPLFQLIQIPSERESPEWEVRLVGFDSGPPSTD